MYESGNPKRKRKRQQVDTVRQARLFLAFGIMMFVILMGGIGLMVLMTRMTSDDSLEQTVTAIMATNQRVEVLIAGTEWAATAYPPPPAPTSEVPCTWHVTTRADPNGLTQDVQKALDQAALPVNVRAMVYLTGDECLETDVLEGPDFFPRHTDFYLLVRVDDRYLNPDIENDTETRAQLGFLVRQILNVIDAGFTPDKTEGGEPGIITMTFINGGMVRSASFTQDELAISHYNAYEVGTAIIAALGDLQRP